MLTLRSFVSIFLIPKDEEISEIFPIKTSSFFLIYFLLTFINTQANILDKKSDLNQLYESAVKSGEAQKKGGNFKQAIDAFTQALKLAREIDNKEEEVDCLMSLGLMYWNIGQLEQSSEKYNQALALAQKINLNDRKQECRNSLEIYRLYEDGKKFRDTNEYQKSIESFQKAIDLARRTGSKEHEVKCLRQLSLTYWELNDIKALYSLNEEGLKIAKELNHRKEQGRCLNNIGLFHWGLNNYSKAINYFSDAMYFAQKEKDLDDESICLNNIGLIYQEMGSCEKAERYFLRATLINKNLRNNFYLQVNMLNLGVNYLRKGAILRCEKDFYKALDYFNNCLKLIRETRDIKTEIKVLNNIGFVYTDLKKYWDASHYFKLGLEKAEEAKDFETRSMILNNMGIVHFNLGDYEKSINLYQRAVEIANEIGAGHILWEAYLGLGQCYEKIDDYRCALIYYKKAVDTIDHMRSQISIDVYKAGFVRDKFRVYESLINLLCRLNRDNASKSYTKELFQVIEKAKARAFMESLGESKIDIGERLSPELKKRENEVSDKISLVMQELSKHDLSRKKREELLNALQQEEDDYLSLISKMRVEDSGIAELLNPLSCQVEQVQQRLDGNTGLIEYFLGENQSIMFFITKNSIEVYPLPSRSEIERSLKAYLKSLSDSPKKRFRGILAAQRIYREILPNIPDYVENLIIVPDGVLYYLPFESLVFSHQSQKMENMYLIEKYKISYIPSSSALLFLSENKPESKRSKNLLAFGNPAYSLTNSSKRKESETEVEVMRELYLDQGFDFSSLPHSEEEVLGISSYFPRERRDVYIKDEAKEEVFKRISLKDYRIIHFACHGFLSEEYPFRSALVLSLDEDPAEDGFIQVRELYNIRLGADLVVLSACQTGRGRMERGEGLLGLPRIFFYTGAKSVISTLWRINDESTAVFMNWFYRYLSEGKDKAQALRLAKLRMLDSRYSHPFYWASFVLNGDYNSVINFK